MSISIEVYELHRSDSSFGDNVDGGGSAHSYVFITGRDGRGPQQTNASATGTSSISPSTRPAGFI